MNIQIHITREILEKSKDCKGSWNEENKGNASNCAIALAVRDIFPRACVGVYGLSHNHFEKVEKGEIQMHEWKRNIDFPAHVSNFIEDFDMATPKERANITPFSFNIEVPDEVIEEIGITEVTEILSKSPTLELVEEF